VFKRQILTYVDPSPVLNKETAQTRRNECHASRSPYFLLPRAAQKVFPERIVI
jgi:hypothetical protein